jgi:prophage endopeptidase
MNSLQRLGLAVVVTGLLLFGIYRYGYHNGWYDRDADMQAAIAQKNEEARQTEQKLNEKLNANATRLQEANHVITEKQSALDRAIRSGRLRFPAASCVQSPAYSAPATGDRNQAPSQPDRPADEPSDSERATLSAIAEIVAQGERNTAQLNACIDAYNEVREKINGDR